MTPTDDSSLPPALVAVAGVEFDYNDGEGVDYEPYAEFKSAEQTTVWLRAWTGNSELNGNRFRPFGMDGTGGQVAFWMAHTNRPLADQPVVFLGSEGETGVVARDLASYLWLLADGFGPFEAIDSPERAARPNPELVAIAERFAGVRRQPAAAVIAEAAHAFPDFDQTIAALCR